MCVVTIFDAEQLSNDRMACETVERIVLKFVTGLAENATSWEKRNNKRYGR